MKEFAKSISSAALDVMKAHVKGHYRTVNGKRVWVEAYEDKRQARTNATSSKTAVPKLPGSAFYHAPAGSPVRQLIDRIEAHVAANGQQLHRWINRSYPYIQPGSPEITYAVLSKEAGRPSQASRAIKRSDVIAWTRFVGHEGKTERNNAFRQLKALAQELGVAD